MAGKKRRTRCEQCKQMFQFGETGYSQKGITHKLQSWEPTSKLNTRFCSNKCLRDYAIGIVLKEQEDFEISNGVQLKLTVTVTQDGFGHVSIESVERKE